MARRRDLMGQRFGKLLAMYPTDKRDYNGNIVWHCLCDCGSSCDVSGRDLCRGQITDCGCVRKLSAEEYRALTNSRLHNIWTGMRQRCYNFRSPAYADYGAVGITVCEEWSDFLTFYNWAICNGYSDDLSLDRINVFREYSPANCRWANNSVQNLNKRRRYFSVLYSILENAVDFYVTKRNRGYVREYLQLVFTEDYWRKVFALASYDAIHPDFEKDLRFGIDCHVFIYLKFLDWCFDYYQYHVNYGYTPNEIVLRSLRECRFPMPDLRYESFVNTLESYFRSLEWK